MIAGILITINHYPLYRFIITHVHIQGVEICVPPLV